MSAYSARGRQGGGVALLAAVIGLSVWVGRPEYRVLYSNLGAEDASHVVKALQTDKIPIRPADNGHHHLICHEVVYDQRIKIAGEGGLVGQGIGFEIFDKVKVEAQTDCAENQLHLARSRRTFSTIR